VRVELTDEEIALILRRLEAEPPIYAVERSYDEVDLIRSIKRKLNYGSMRM
jgi:hypothetical protein